MMLCITRYIREGDTREPGAIINLYTCLWPRPPDKNVRLWVPYAKLGSYKLELTKFFYKWIIYENRKKDYYMLGSYDNYATRVWRWLRLSLSKKVEFLTISRKPKNITKYFSRIRRRWNLGWIPPDGILRDCT